MPSTHVPSDRYLKLQHRAGDQRAREKLIVRYLPLARNLARRYRGAHDSLDDLVQVASLGLVKAVDRWDPARGTAFSSFAVPTVLGELRRFFRDSTWLVRPPRPVAELSVSLERAREHLTGVHGHEPTIAELAAHLHCSTEALMEAMVATSGRRGCAIDEQPTSGGEDRELRQVEGRLAFEQLTAPLDDRARTVLRLRFCGDLRQAEIAERIGCSQMHVSRILRSSLDRLDVAA